MCPTHPICPDKLLFWGLRTVLNIFSNLFCWSLPLALKVPVQRLCTVCLTTVTYFAINLGYFFFQSEDSIILCLIVASTLCMCKLWPVVTESSNNSLLNHSSPCTATRAVSTASPRIWEAPVTLCSTFGMLLGFPREPQPPRHRHPSHSSVATSCNSLCNFKCSVTTTRRSKARLQAQGAPGWE